MREEVSSVEGPLVEAPDHAGLARVRVAVVPRPAVRLPRRHDPAPPRAAGRQRAAIARVAHDSRVSQPAGRFFSIAVFSFPMQRAKRRRLAVEIARRPGYPAHPGRARRREARRVGSLAPSARRAALPCRPDGRRARSPVPATAPTPHTLFMPAQPGASLCDDGPACAMHGALAPRMRSAFASRAPRARPPRRARDLPTRRHDQGA